MKNIDEIMKQYAKDMGMTEDQLASYILQEHGEPQKGIVTPDDNGWTDLKKLGLAIGDSWMNHRNNTDPMWRVGLVNAIFGDPSMLGQYYQMQNNAREAALQRRFQALENEKNRKAQIEMNDKFNSEDANVKAKEKERQVKAVELIDELRDAVESGGLTRDEAIAKAHQAYREDALSYEELKDARSRLEAKTKSEVEAEEEETRNKQISQRYGDNTVNRDIAEINEAAAKAKEQKKLAERARKKRAAGKALTRKEQAALDAEE